MNFGQRGILHCTPSCRTPVGCPRAHGTRGCTADVWSRRRLPIRAKILEGMFGVKQPMAVKSREPKKQ